MKNGGQGRLTSVLHPLLRLWTPYQTEGWEWPRPGATTSAPGSFGFGDTETKTRQNAQQLETQNTAPDAAIIWGSRRVYVVGDRRQFTASIKRNETPIFSGHSAPLPSDA